MGMYLERYLFLAAVLFLLLLLEATPAPFLVTALFLAAAVTAFLGF